MKKVLAIILFLFMSAGFLFAFTLSDSTVTLGIGFDTISGSGYSYDTGESFNSRTPNRCRNIRSRDVSRSEFISEKNLANSPTQG